MSHDPRCAFVADDLLHARVVIGWLEEHGIPAQVPQVYVRDESDLLTLHGRGVPVWVTNPEQVEEAARMLTEREWTRVMKETEEDLSDERIPVICEECGRVSMFLPQSRGSCQLCQHCGAYVDVGDEDDEVKDEPADERPSSDGIQRRSDQLRPEADE